MAPDTKGNVMGYFKIPTSKIDIPGNEEYEQYQSLHQIGNKSVKEGKRED